MMWLSKNTGVLDCFSPQKWELRPVICHKVAQCSGSLTFSLVSATSTNDIPPHEPKELWIALNCMRP